MRYLVPMNSWEVLLCGSLNLLQKILVSLAVIIAVSLAVIIAALTHCNCAQQECTIVHYCTTCPLIVHNGL